MNFQGCAELLLVTCISATAKTNRLHDHDIVSWPYSFTNESETQIWSNEHLSQICQPPFLVGMEEGS